MSNQAEVTAVTPKSFENKLSLWLAEAQDYIGYQFSQEQIFDLMRNVNYIDATDEEKKLIETLTSLFLKLSFITQNDAQGTAKFIQYYE